MADSPEKKIDIIYNNLKNDVTPTDVMRRIGRAQAALAEDLCRERTNKGLDVNGRPFKNYSPKYAKRKRQIISGKAKLTSGRRTAFAAKGLPSYARLSGTAFAAMHYTALKVSRSGGELSVTFRLGFKSAAMAKRAGYNKEQGYDWFGLARPGTAYGQMERKKILRLGTDGLKLNARARGVVLQDDA